MNRGPGSMWSGRMATVGGVDAVDARAGSVAPSTTSTRSTPSTVADPRHSDPPLTLTASSIYNIFLRSKIGSATRKNHAPPRYDHYRSSVCGVLFAPS